MKLLCVGGNGHYAGMMTGHLAKKHDVTIFDLNDTPNEYGCKQVAGDISKIDELRNTAKGNEAIVSFFFGDTEPSVAGMANIMVVAEQLDIEHVVYTSSGGMSMPSNSYTSDKPLFPIDGFPESYWADFFPIKEEVGLFPGNEVEDYFINKWVCEEIGQHLAARGKVKFTSIRPGLIMHDDLTNREGGETTRNFDPFFMLMTGQVTVRDIAHMMDLALQKPPADGFAAYHCSNDTPYNNLSVEKAKRELDWESLDHDAYMAYYKKPEFDWAGALAELVRKGFPESVLKNLYAFKSVGA